LKYKKEELNIKKENTKVTAALLETAGQFFYVFAMANDSTISATIVGSYCILSLILSHIFLKEKLTKNKYIAIIIALIGLFILTILNI
jgi:EamA domain-containing membrane protein RarD